MGNLPIRNTSPLLLIFTLIIHPISAATTDSIDTSGSIRDGETMVSSGGIFELGFFNPGNSTNRYVGIWYKNTAVRTYVWVANRQAPLTTKTGVLQLIHPGILALFNQTNGVVVWSSNSSISTSVVANPVVQIQDSGNLVVHDPNDESVIVWQSFDHPTDTYLPGMMSLGWNLVTGVETYLSSWKSNDDPAPGDYTFHLDPTVYPGLVIKLLGTKVFRGGPWNGIRFSGAPAQSSIIQILVMNKDEVRYGEDVVDRSVLSKSTLSPDGIYVRQSLSRRTKSWTTLRNSPSDRCGNYGLCGAYGVCNAGISPPCGCLDRFVPKAPMEWNGADWSNGCVRRIQLNCRGDVFLTYSGIKLPDVLNTSIDEGMRSLEECETECSRKCSCVAYTQLNISGGGNGCLFYHGELIDIRTIASGGQDLYIRMASAERDHVGSSKGKNRVIVRVLSVVGALILCIGLVLIHGRIRKTKGQRQVEEFDLPFFSLSTIIQATDNFSTSNKLGEGGFGPVYKGKLEDGREIAVKRLSKTSSQGAEELKNEVMLIAKLQHRNLVRVLGSCIQGEENMLVYEYMPNSSLDMLLFDEAKCTLLDWDKRFKIINGIAKGLSYLHQDSRLRIIHRDLKASNILLDADMNPKISDFGLAKSFGGNETEARTRRVVGTYGYMSPEYMMKGLFSTKSDVFSFGVLLLEVVAGKGNRDFSLKDQNLNLIGHAWRLYKEESLLELVDASLGDLFDKSEAARSIHVGLLCVQKCPEDRPSMSSVVFMLGNEVQLPQPKTPAFLTEGDVCGAQSFTGKVVANSVNQLSVSLVVGR